MSAVDSLLDEQEWCGDEETSQSSKQRVPASNAKAREHAVCKEGECRAKGGSEEVVQGEDRADLGEVAIAEI
jgi:hypothetical protein